MLDRNRPKPIGRDGGTGRMEETWSPPSDQSTKYVVPDQSIGLLVPVHHSQMGAPSIGGGPLSARLESKEIASSQELPFQEDPV